MKKKEDYFRNHYFGSQHHVIILLPLCHTNSIRAKGIYLAKQVGREWYLDEFVDKGSVHEAWPIVSILYSTGRGQSIDYRWV